MYKEGTERELAGSTLRRAESAAADEKQAAEQASGGENSVTLASEVGTSHQELREEQADAQVVEIKCAPVI